MQAKKAVYRLLPGRPKSWKSRGLRSREFLLERRQLCKEGESADTKMAGGLTSRRFAAKGEIDIFRTTS
jgi:hypothetical protein